MLNAAMPFSVGDKIKYAHDNGCLIRGTIVEIWKPGYTPSEQEVYKYADREYDLIARPCGVYRLIVYTADRGEYVILPTGYHSDVDYSVPSGGFPYSQ